MASSFTLPTLSEALVSIISALGDEPNTDNGLTATQLKAKFDEAPKNIRTFLNSSLISALQTKIRELEDSITGFVAQTANIANSAVTAAKLASNAVTTAKIANSNVTTDKLANSAVTAPKIAAGAVSTSYSGTINTNNWTGSSAPYTAAITVNGLLATDKPIVDAVMSGTYSTDAERDAAWSVIYRAVTSANAITFYANEKPSVALPFNLLCVRK